MKILLVLFTVVFVFGCSNDFEIYFCRVKYRSSSTVAKCTWADFTDLSPLEAMTNLEFLDISFSQFSDLTPIRNIKSLETIWAKYTPVEDLGPLSNLENIRELDVSFTQVIDITPIMGLTNLRYLDIKGTQVDPEQVEAFKAAHPDCTVYWP